MKGVIMAGGEGTRLRPLTSNAPKPLLPIADRPMMEHIIGLLARHGITDIVVTVAFMAEAIRDYFGDGREFGVSLTLDVKRKILGENAARIYGIDIDAQKKELAKDAVAAMR